MPVERPPKVNPSMLDVARHVGVSIATVSNVLNRPEKVTQATAERVRAAIADLGFVRNDAARSLATGTNRSLGMVLADLDNSLFVDMAHGAQEDADKAGMRLILGNAACDASRQDSFLDLFDESRVAGMLLAPMEDSRLGIERMRAHGRPIVLLNYDQIDTDCCTVLVDNEMVGYVAARHLIDQGRKRIAFIAAREYYQPVHARHLGVRRAVDEAGDAILEEIHTDGLLFEDGMHVARAFADRPTRDLPDGVVAVTDELGTGFIDAILSLGIATVPGDIAVVGCEDNRSARSSSVSLTTVHLAGTAMGEAAVQLVLEELADGPRHQHRTITLTPTLLPRASSVAADLARL